MAQATQHIELTVKGMTCTNCALGIEKYLKGEGLDQVRVNFGNDEVLFDTVEPERLPDIVKGIENLGFQVQDEEAEEQEGWSAVEKYFYFTLPFTLLLILHMFLPHGTWLHNPWVQLGLALPVYLVGMYHFGRSGWRSLRNGLPNMDVLISLGATAAFFYSLYGTLTLAGPDFLFYETAASILSLVLLGNLLEHKAVQRTTTAIKDLSALQPEKARLVMKVGKIETIHEVGLEHVNIGDELQVNQGDRVPVDGILLSGEVEVDESMISGESLPVAKTKGDALIGGTILVDGQARIEAVAIGSSTTLARIIDLVKRAQIDKPSIQQLADKISGVFVPAVLGVAALTFVLSYFAFGIGLQAAIIHSVAVLVIACPCAMGLATPTAVIVGIGRASKRGILIKGGRTLEAFGKVKRMVFDKTGTLTTGAFAIAALQTEADVEEVRSIIYSLEQHSSHPIARSLVRELEGSEGFAFAEVKEIKGLGLQATDREGNQYQLGSKRLDPEGKGTHDLYLLKNGVLWATVDLQDEVRPGAQEMIAFLHQKGIETIMLSGDRKEKCELLASQLGIDRVYAEQLPDEKLALIESLSEEAATAMVGDGINDAPALARATVGISLGNATDIAIQSSEIVLLKDNLNLIPELYKVSQHTVMTIKQNLFWAFFYNVLAIPLAAIGLLTPIVGAATMAMSDVVVIGNSLRLKTKRI